MSFVLALASGLIFGIGLLLSGMTDPAKVRGFLDVFGLWNPSLAMVMGAALVMAMPGFVWAKARLKNARTALNGQAIALPQATSIDARLVAGGVLFGIGWGIAGYCPGPAVVAASSGSVAALVFVAAMAIGFRLAPKD